MKGGNLRKRGGVDLERVGGYDPPYQICNCTSLLIASDAFGTEYKHISKSCSGSFFAVSSTFFLFCLKQLCRVFRQVFDIIYKYSYRMGKWLNEVI